MRHCFALRSCLTRAALLAFALLVVAIPRSARCGELPAFTGYVVDRAQIIDAASLQQFTQLASQLDHAGIAQLALCTISAETLGDTSKEEYATALFKQWGLGHGKKKADGVLILLVPGQPGHRKIKVEIGYGLEGILPDGKVGALLDQLAVPHLKRDEYGQAAASLAVGIAQVLSADAAAGGDSARSEDGMRGGIGMGGGQDPTDEVFGLAAAVIAMCALLVVLMVSAGRRRFPGAGTALIGAALVGASVFAILVFGGLSGWFALAVGLVVNGLSYWSILSHKCPQCGAWVRIHERVLVVPTAFSTGMAHVRERCTRCNYGRDYDRVLSRRSPSSSYSGGGGGSSWSDSGGGGGFSGGGGGDSGGGGAGRDV